MSTSRLKKPTSLTRPTSTRNSTYDKESNIQSQTKLTPIREHNYAPKINKNTDKLLQAREARIQQRAKSPAGVNTPQRGKKEMPDKDLPKVKPTDKYLIQKFNKDFDLV